MNLKTNSTKKSTVKPVDPSNMLNYLKNHLSSISRNMRLLPLLLHSPRKKYMTYTHHSLKSSKLLLINLSREEVLNVQILVISKTTIFIPTALCAKETFSMELWFTIVLLNSELGKSISKWTQPSLLIFRGGSNH